MAVEELRCYRHPNRETMVRCSECDRPICSDCMTMAPVGIRCPEHSGKPQGVAKITRGARRATYEGTGALVTKALILVNVIVYFGSLAQGSSFQNNSGSLYERGGLLIRGFSNFDGSEIGLVDGEWYRLLTSAFLHADGRHIFMNMITLWFIGGPVESAIGRGRFLALYVVSGLAGSAGALLWTPLAFTVGASGAIWGILGAAVVLERQRQYVLGGSAVLLVVLNLAFTYFIPGISKGGHIGGFIGGALCALAFSRFGRTHAIYGRPGLAGALTIGLVAIASLVTSYWVVSGYM